MPDTMSRERYERIQKYGAQLDLTPGSESDVILTLERTRESYVGKKDFLVLAQFELFPITDSITTSPVMPRSAPRPVWKRPNRCLCGSAGSAGTLAAGDAIKARYSESSSSRSSRASVRPFTTADRVNTESRASATRW